MSTIPRPRLGDAPTAEELAAAHPDPIDLAAAITVEARRVSTLSVELATLRRLALLAALASGISGAALGRRVGLCQSRISRLTAGRDDGLAGLAVAA